MWNNEKMYLSNCWKNISNKAVFVLKFIYKKRNPNKNRICNNISVQSKNNFFHAKFVDHSIKFDKYKKKLIKKNFSLLQTTFFNYLSTVHKNGINRNIIKISSIVE